jgi:hypothetical protein
MGGKVEGTLILMLSAMYKPILCALAIAVESVSEVSQELRAESLRPQNKRERTLTKG